MKSDGELMDILNAYDLTGSYRAAAQLCGCSHNTVKKAVEGRAAGLPPAVRRARLIDDWHDVLEGWVAESRGKIRGDVAHRRLQALGYTGTDRTTRRALSEIKTQWRLGNTRVHRPWVTEPGLWLQYDFGDGPVVDGRKLVLLVAWLAWCRYRVVLVLRDRTAASVFAGLDRVFRILGGAPTYLLTDNEKTVTTGHIAGVPVRNRQAVTFGRYYGISVLTCAPADPASKGGVENAVKLAKADIVPTETNLLSRYDSVAAVEAAAAEFMDQVNTRTHRATGRVPAEMLTEERPRLHAIPDLPHTAALGVTRRVPDTTPMITFEHGQYSVPATLLGHSVWVRHHAGTDEIVVCALDDGGPVEVARHRRTTVGSPAIDDRHFPDHRATVPGDYRVRARTAAEHAFLAIGEGAACWLKEAAAVGTERMGQKMAHAVALSTLVDRADVDWALGHAAVHGRFATGDLDSILRAKGLDPTRHRAREDTSLAQGTRGWTLLGATGPDEEVGA
ncbi:IS21 family transposase [Rhodococcus sp. DMU1]|uniref:IS21 family transposase n=1 Tax=Rhodococcus sp. DMU1 TaxID=2722825 RepID=UPI00143E1089|nr:IS21 family transposase [Rhodococcus sp. DMU1]QIX51881.1 IS21 family transposase [Rhodococcus sp. DMU1]QIX52319.1 IS21 family transposase [Rhodococcus sp. DMU1]